MPDALLTGGTGFIGGALLRRLVADGRSVRALVRSDEGREAVETAGAEAVDGDVTEPDSLPAAMADCATVFHVAGLNAMCLRNPLRLEQVNVDGSVAVVHAAADAGVSRVVYTSSAASIGEPHGEVGTETTAHRGWYVTSYERSKHLAEVAVFEAARERGIDVVAVNPSSVQGPGRVGGTARLLIKYLDGSLRYAVRSRMSLVSIDDCVEAHLLAERSGTPGERYLINGAVLTVEEAVALLGAITREKRRVRYLPRWVVRTGAAVVGGVSHLLRRDAPFCREMAAAILHGHTYDGTRAERELGLRYTPLSEWMADTVEWYRAHGIV